MRVGGPQTLQLAQSKEGRGLWCSQALPLPLCTPVLARPTICQACAMHEVCSRTLLSTHHTLPAIQQPAQAPLLCSYGGILSKAPPCGLMGVSPRVYAVWGYPALTGCFHLAQVPVQLSLRCPPPQLQPLL